MRAPKHNLKEKRLANYWGTAPPPKKKITRTHAKVYVYLLTRQNDRIKRFCTDQGSSSVHLLWSSHSQ